MLDRLAAVSMATGLIPTCFTIVTLVAVSLLIHLSYCALYSKLMSEICENCEIAIRIRSFAYENGWRGFQIVQLQLQLPNSEIKCFNVASNRCID